VSEAGKVADIAKPALKAAPVSANVKIQPDPKLKVEVKTEAPKPGKLSKVVDKTAKIGQSRIVRILAKVAYAVTKNYVMYRHRLKARRLKKKGIHA